MSWGLHSSPAAKGQKALRGAVPQAPDAGGPHQVAQRETVVREADAVDEEAHGPLQHPHLATDSAGTQQW